MSHCVLRNAAGLSAFDLRRLAAATAAQAPTQAAAYLAEAESLIADASGGRLRLLEVRGPLGLYQCHCGAKALLRNRHVARGLTRSCGCLDRELNRAGRKPKTICLPGSRYGKWLVQGEAGRDQHGGRLVQAVCDCGFVARILAKNLHNGGSKACLACAGLARRGQPRKARNAEGVAA